MAYEKKEYVQSDAVKQAQEKLAAQQGLKPGAYQSQWQTQLNDTMNKILNREDFKYDMNADALYQQLKDRTVNLGQQAMMDTMGQAAKLTGGYGNSYAQTVGQQAYQAQLQGLTDRMPELYQLALDQYNRQGQDLYQKVGLLGDQDDRDYNRYLADYDMWSGERDYLTGRLDADRNFDYGSFRDTVADSQWQAEFDEALRQFNFANKLGEFAPKGGGGGGGGGSGVRSPGGNSNYEIVKNNVEAVRDSGTYAQTIQDNMAQIRAAVSDGLITKSQAKKLAANLR